MGTAVDMNETQSGSSHIAQKISFGIISRTCGGQFTTVLKNLQVLFWCKSIHVKMGKHTEYKSSVIS